MIARWSGIESRTRGLVAGTALLSADGPSASLFARDGIIRPDWALDGLRPLAWAPHVISYKIVIRAREGGEVLWVRPFADRHQALVAWARAIGVDTDAYAPGTRLELPPYVISGELEYIFATVETFNSTPGGSQWTVPPGVTATDYLAAAGGGSGATGANGGYHGGGGGAGDYLAGSAHATSPGASLTLTVGPGGTGPSTSETDGADGTDTVFDTLTATKGGGAGHGSAAANSGSGRTGGSGGGGGGAASGSAGSGGATSGAGAHNAGGGGSADNSGYAGGGGGSSTAGTGPSPAGTTNRGAGTSNSISGAALTYAQGGNIGTGNNAAPVDGTANRGNGGGGVDFGGSATRAGHGGYGVVILSYTAVFTSLIFKPRTIEHLLVR